MRIGGRAHTRHETRNLLAPVASGHILRRMFGSVSETAKNWVEVGAILLGGGWTYFRFIRGRIFHPRATITHRMFHRALPNGRTLVHVTAVLKNEGSTILSLPDATFRLQQVVPLPDSIAEMLERKADPVEAGEVNWPGLGERDFHCAVKIEPGETDEVSADFFLDDPAPELVEVYTYFKNERAEGIGWHLTTLYDIQQEKGRAERTVSDLSQRSE